MHDVSCFVFHASFCMPYVMLLRVMFYGMLDASHPMSFMSYRVKASTSADIVGMRLQERSMKADADHGNLIHVSNHVSFPSYRRCQTCMMTLLECVHRNMKADTGQGDMTRYSGVMRLLSYG